MTMSVISPPTATSLKKWPPNAMRSPLAATPKAKAPPSAATRHAGGASSAGATIQNACAASPEAKEQFFAQAAVELIPRLELGGSAKFDEVHGPRPMRMLLQTDVDDKARRERHGEGEKQRRPPARRQRQRNAERLQSPSGDKDDEQHVRGDAEKIPPDPIPSAGAEETMGSVEEARNFEVELGPQREYDERRGERGDKRYERAIHALDAPRLSSQRKRGGRPVISQFVTVVNTASPAPSTGRPSRKQSHAGGRRHVAVKAATGCRSGSHVTAPLPPAPSGG